MLIIYPFSDDILLYKPVNYGAEAPTFTGCQSIYQSQDLTHNYSKIQLLPITYSKKPFWSILQSVFQCAFLSLLQILTGFQAYSCCIAYSPAQVRGHLWSPSGIYTWPAPFQHTMKPISDLFSNVNLILHADDILFQACEL